MSPSKEKKIGDQQHAKIIAEFGGVYKDDNLGGYIATIGGSIASNTETPEKEFTFTILDSPVVNAFAVPGGYIYLTRGILALVNSESELAYIIAHEIAHVVARHSAQRYSSAILTQLGRVIIESSVSNPTVDIFSDLGSDLILAKYSQTQEFEADMLGVRYLEKTGYSTLSSSKTLESLILHKNYQEIKFNKKIPKNNIFSTHPDTSKRIERTLKLSHKNKGLELKKNFLLNIEGLVYGDATSQGIVKNNIFSHPDLNLEFSLPANYKINNQNNYVIANKKNNSLVKFDLAPKNTHHPNILVYLENIWGENLKFNYIDEINVNGYKGATGIIQTKGTLGDYKGELEVRYVAIKFDSKILRFIFIGALAEKNIVAEGYKEVINSIRYLSNEDKKTIKPLRVRLYTVKKNDTIETISSKQDIEENKADLFKALNRIKSNKELKLGDIVKIIKY
ncbi:M48 family metalloprotease [Alphaproteobacteria bacterium]|nr:M48 family metalloprotease [Alphaproteobacteria bacterium]